MSEKNLTEQEWKKFAKGKDFKDAALLKALIALDKAKGAEQELAALDELEKQADLLRKATKGDKELLAYLDVLDKSLDKQRKQAAKPAETEDEEGDTPDLLTTKLVPLLKQVKKGDPMHVMLANNGKEVSVMLSRRSISPSRRKLLAEYLDSGGAPKYISGTCIFEANAYTFVMATQAAGLAKKLKAALFKQINLRVKVRVRGEDPDDIDDDGDPDDGSDALDTASAAPAGKAEAPAATTAPDPLKGPFDKRMALVKPRILAALKEGQGDVAKIKSVAEFIRDKADGGNYKAATQGLDMIETLLSAASAAAASTAPAATTATTAPVTPEPKAGPAGVDEAAAFNARLTALLPAIKAAPGEAGQTAKLKASEAGNLARKKEFGKADALLDEIETVLAGKGKEPAAASSLQQRWDEQSDQLSTQLARLQRLAPVEAAKIEKVMALARTRAEAGDPAKALEALKEVEKMIAAATVAAQTQQKAGEGGYKGLVAYRASLLEFRKAVATVRNQIKDLQSSIPKHLPDEADLAEDISSTIEDYTADMLEAVDQAMNTAENVDSPITRQLADRINAFASEVGTNAVVKHVDNNPFGVKVSIGATLGTALKAVLAALPPVA